MTKEEFKKFVNEKMDDPRQSLGDVIYDAIEDDNSSYTMGKYAVNEFLGFKTKKEFEAGEKILIAITGYGLDTLVERVLEKEEK